MVLVKYILKTASQISVFIASYLFIGKCSSLKEVGFLIANPVNQVLGVHKNRCPILALQRKQVKNSRSLFSSSTNLNADTAETLYNKTTLKSYSLLSI